MTKKNVYTFLVSFSFLAICGQVFVQFLLYHQKKINAGGYQFNDYVLELFPRGDFSIYIFGITYSCLLIYILFRLNKIQDISKFMVTYGLILLTRMITLTLVPLEEPVDLVSLNDPILYNVIFSGEITADLFYSGHTAFIFAMYFLSKKKFYIVMGSIMGVLLMMQRVHFSIDIAAAIPVSYLLVAGVNKFFTKVLKVY